MEAVLMIGENCLTCGKIPCECYRDPLFRIRLTPVENHLLNAPALKEIFPKGIPTGKAITAYQQFWYYDPETNRLIVGHEYFLEDLERA